jgi:hypothetical protein
MLALGLLSALAGQAHAQQEEDDGYLSREMSAYYPRLGTTIGRGCPSSQQEGRRLGRDPPNQFTLRFPDGPRDTARSAASSSGPQRPVLHESAQSTQRYMRLAPMFGLVSHQMRQSSRVLAIRMALGASPGTLLRTVLRTMASLIAIGVGVFSQVFHLVLDLNLGPVIWLQLPVHLELGRR